MYINFNIDIQVEIVVTIVTYALHEILLQIKKGKVDPAAMERRWGAHLPLGGREPVVG